MYEEDLALNNLQWLICHKTESNVLILTKHPHTHIHIIYIYYSAECYQLLL